MLDDHLGEAAGDDPVPRHEHADAPGPDAADPVTDPGDPTAAGTRRRRGGGTILGAAMLAVGEILEPEKTSVEIVQTDDDPPDDGDLPFTLDFGDLPPLA